MMIRTIAAALASAILSISGASAQTFPGQLPAFSLFGNPTASQAAPQAYPLLSAPNAWSATQTQTPATPITTTVQGWLFATTNPTTVSGAPAELDHLRCSQSSGANNQYVIGGTNSVVACLTFEMQANLGSAVSSNLYGVWGAVNNFGAGTVAGLYGRGSAGNNTATGNVVAIKSGANCGTALASCYGVQTNIDTTSFGGVANALFWGASLQGTLASGSAHYGVLLDSTVSYDSAQFAGYLVGAGNFLQALDSTGANVRYVVSGLGNPVQCNGASGNSAANCVQQQTVGAFTNWNWNWPISSGGLGSILVSQGGGGTPMVWLDDTAVGQVIVSGGVGANPSYSNIPSVATIRTIPTVFSSLPSCVAGIQGTRAFITDSNSIVFHATAAGGGANKMGVTCDGTIWYVD